MFAHNFPKMASSRLLPTIDAIATGTPDNIVLQADAAQFIANFPTLEQNRHRIEKLYKNTRIDSRHLAVNLLSDETVVFSQRASTVAKRMEMYEEHAVPLAEKVVRKAITHANEKGLSLETLKESIRLIVFVSSTGFVAPGIDTKIIESLGLRRDIARVPLNFMGCAAAMNGLRVACDHVRSNPYHKALVICLELSSVNAAFEDELNDVIIHSLFGDGCAAVIVGSCEEDDAKAKNKVVIRDNFSYLVEDTQDGIKLGVRDNGITCKLSSQLPNYIEAGVDSIVQRFLSSHDLTKENIDLWAVHPGGTRIIEKVQSAVGLTDDQVADSWVILREYGNMLSAAVLFVIERMLLRLNQEEARLNPLNHKGKDSTAYKTTKTGIAFSFSPGVGVEGILFQTF